MAQRILFVEGPSELLYYPACARRLEIRLEFPRVQLIPIRGVGKGKYHLRVWAEVARYTPAEVFMLLDGDEDAKTAAEGLRRSGLIPPDHIWNLTNDGIEDYYPLDLMVNALSDILELTDEDKEYLRKSLPETERAKWVDEWVRQNKKELEDRWKVPLARRVSASLGKGDIPPEVQEYIERITGQPP